MTIRFWKWIPCVLAVAVWTGLPVLSPQWGGDNVAHADSDSGSGRDSDSHSDSGSDSDSDSGSDSDSDSGSDSCSDSDSGHGRAFKVYVSAGPEGGDGTATNPFGQ